MNKNARTASASSFWVKTTSRKGGSDRERATRRPPFRSSSTVLSEVAARSTFSVLSDSSARSRLTVLSDPSPATNRSTCCPSRFNRSEISRTRSLRGWCPPFGVRPRSCQAKGNSSDALIRGDHRAMFISKTSLTTWPPVRFKTTHQPPAQRGNEMADSVRSATRERLSGVHSKVTIERLDCAIAVTADCMTRHNLPELLPTLKRLEAARDDLRANGDPIEYARRVLTKLAA
jgi:hypothetical protein